MYAMCIKKIYLFAVLADPILATKFLLQQVGVFNNYVSEKLYFYFIKAGR